MIDKSENISDVCDFIDNYVKSDREMLSAHISLLKERIRESLANSNSAEKDFLIKRL